MSQEPLVLIVEDDQTLLEGLAAALEAERFQVRTAASAAAALQITAAQQPDVVILDVGLPDGSGFDVCRDIRQSHPDAAIIMLTGRAEEVDVVVGLELGADDYVTKPFRVRELMARVRASLRRKKPRRGDTLSSIRFGNVQIDFETYNAKRNGKSTELTPKLFELLRVLAKHRGEVVTRERILTEVWGYHASSATRTVDAHIKKLRQKIEEDPVRPKYIISVYGEGYKFLG